ncbi:MAG: phosphoglycerate dehydrogenase [Deltaproteobacteria bacterium]|nr:phosphoglycerate dehydrogenase [Deltaproteobacteria bacterium]
MKRVLISDKLAVEGVEILKAAEGIQVDIKTGLTPEELKGIIKDYDALVIRSATKVTADVIATATNLKVVGRAGIGVDNVDVLAASKQGIVVMNTPGGNTVTTAEHAVAMMCSLARQIPQATASMKAGKWEKNKFMGAELFNKTLAIIGIGRVGSIVADRAQGLKMQVIAYDPFLTKESAEALGVSLVSLDELYARADFISIHSPATKETKNLLNAQAFAKMKKGVFVINCARGGIIHEGDLHDALVSGKVAGAALDVFEEEPTKNTALVGLENIICTPHLGASTDEAQVNVAIAVAEQIVAFLTTGEIKNAVNFPSVQVEILGIIRPYIALAEKLGKFHTQISSGPIQDVTVEYSGEIINFNVAPLTIALLKGLLSPILTEAVNFVNAPIVAKERGIRVNEVKSTRVGDFSSMITLTTTGQGETAYTAGTLFGKQEARIVGIDKFTVEAIPEGHMLCVYNHDRPGVIGNLGTKLGENGINISRMHLSRDEQQKEALVILSTDTAVGANVLEQLSSLPHVISVTALEM